MKLSKILPFAITLFIIIIGSAMFCSTCREIHQMETELYTKTPPQGISLTLLVVLLLIAAVIIAIFEVKK